MVPNGHDQNLNKNDIMAEKVVPRMPLELVSFWGTGDSGGKPHTLPQDKAEFDLILNE